MGQRMQGKAVIVTGAGSVGPGMGNGKASSILYAREGGRVLLADQNFEAAIFQDQGTPQVASDQGHQG